MLETSTGPNRIMKNFVRILMVLILIACGLSTSAWAITMRIVGPEQLSPIAVSGLKNLGGVDDRLSTAFTEILQRDLKLSGYFRIIDPQTYIEDPQKSGYDLGQFNFGDWSSINVEFLVKGAIKRDGPNVSLEVMLFDVPQQRRMMGKKFSGVPHDVGEMARRFADAILESVTGVRGPFDTRLAFVSIRGGRFKEIYTSWLDGAALNQVTNNPTINLFPSFDKSAHHLLYLSYKTMSPMLYVLDREHGMETTINAHLGQAVGGALTPDGRVVAAFARGGRTNLYLLDRSGNEIRALTEGNGISVSPSVCADGDRMAFTSDRSGTPQIYVMPLAGGAAKRITFKGDYNTTPQFSPKGDKLAYQSRASGRFDIWTISLGGGEPVQITDGNGSNEYPSWSPDGRYLAFSSTRERRSRIYIIMVGNRKIISALTEGNGNDSCPVWSWWLGD